MVQVNSCAASRQAVPALKAIAPMLIDNCVTYHRTGGTGPWQMSSYNMVKGFAPIGVRYWLRS